MRFFLVRHVASGAFMPQMKRGRGYSHWNPGNPSAHVVHAAVMSTPRLLTSHKQAQRVIQLWSQYPNAATRRYESAFGEGDEDFTTKPDGRKPDDLEIVTARLTVTRRTA